MNGLISSSSSFPECQLEVSCSKLNEAFVLFSQRNLESIVSDEQSPNTSFSQCIPPFDFNPLWMVSESPVCQFQYLVDHQRPLKWSSWIWILTLNVIARTTSPQIPLKQMMLSYISLTIAWFSKSNSTFVQFNQFLSRVCDGMHSVVCIIYRVDKLVP